MFYLKELTSRLCCIIIQLFSLFFISYYYNQEYIYLFYKYTLKYNIIIKNLIIINPEDNFLIILKILGLLIIITIIPILTIHYFYFLTPALTQAERKYTLIKNIIFNSSLLIITNLIVKIIIPNLNIYFFWINTTTLKNPIPLNFWLNFNNILQITYFLLFLNIIIHLIIYLIQKNIQVKITKKKKKNIYFYTILLLSIITPIEPLLFFSSICFYTICFELILQLLIYNQNYQKLREVGFEPTTFKKQ